MARGPALDGVRKARPGQDVATANHVEGLRERDAGVMTAGPGPVITATSCTVDFR
jgi:hypothetical protein